MNSPRYTLGPQSPSIQFRIKEAFSYKDLLGFLILRDIKVRYVQSILGIGWAFIQPLFSMLLFTFIFGKIAKIDAGPLPYPLFSYTGLLAWTYFSSALSDGVSSLSNHAHILTKVYFPRAILPTAVLGAKLLDFGISLSFMLVLYAYYSFIPTWALAYFPLWMLLLMGFTLGCSLWLSALSVHYRDVRYGLSFFLQIFQYLCPIAYPLALVPSSLQPWYKLNPLVGIIEGFRHCLCGAQGPPLDLILSSLMGTLILLWSGSVYFYAKEKLFADLI